jgi:hypothetical protein
MIRQIISHGLTRINTDKYRFRIQDSGYCFYYPVYFFLSVKIRVSSVAKLLLLKF